jgi:hypothetical protein
MSSGRNCLMCPWGRSQCVPLSLDSAHCTRSALSLTVRDPQPGAGFLVDPHDRHYASV